MVGKMQGKSEGAMRTRSFRASFALHFFTIQTILHENCAKNHSFKGIVVLSFTAMQCISHTQAVCNFHQNANTHFKLKFILGFLVKHYTTHQSAFCQIAN